MERGKERRERARDWKERSGVSRELRGKHIKLYTISKVTNNNTLEHANQKCDLFILLNLNKLPCGDNS